MEDNCMIDFYRLYKSGSSYHVPFKYVEADNRIYYFLMYDVKCRIIDGNYNEPEWRDMDDFDLDELYSEHMMDMIKTVFTS